MWQGVRAQESPARAALSEWEEDADNTPGLHVYRPILQWQHEEVFAIAKRHGNLSIYFMDDAHRRAIIEEPKKDRIENAISFSKQIEREMPGSENAKTATELKNKLTKQKEEFLVLEKKVEERKKELLDKQKTEEARLNAEKDLKDAEKNSNQIRKDSAEISTPAPGVTFPIKK